MRGSTSGSVNRRTARTGGEERVRDDDRSARRPCDARKNGARRRIFRNEIVRIARNRAGKTNLAGLRRVIKQRVGMGARVRGEENLRNYKNKRQQS